MTRFLTKVPKKQLKNDFASTQVQCLPKRAQGRYSDNADAARLASADALQYTVRDLEPGTEYTCKVEASTKKGFGAPIERTFFTLPEGESGFF